MKIIYILHYSTINGPPPQKKNECFIASRGCQGKKHECFIASRGCQGACPTSQILRHYGQAFSKVSQGHMTHVHAVEQNAACAGSPHDSTPSLGFIPNCVVEQKISETIQSRMCCWERSTPPICGKENPGCTVDIVRYAPA